MLESTLDFLGFNKFIDFDDTAQLMLRLGIDLIAAGAVIRGIYGRRYPWNDYVFTYWAFNIITFCTCFLLRKVPIELGFALGLFAVFGILRYRTEPIRIRDLTYLFVVIGLAILNAVANRFVSVFELLFCNAIIVLMTYLLEFRAPTPALERRRVRYDNLAWIRPGHEDELARDLRERTGLVPNRVEVRSVDLLRDIAVLDVFVQLDNRQIILADADSADPESNDADGTTPHSAVPDGADPAPDTGQMSN